MHVPAWRWSGFAVPLITTALALTGCSGPVPNATTTTVAEAPKRSSAAQAAAPQSSGLPPAGSGRGGYYLDDGPGDNPPEGLELIADAEPRVEPYYARNLRPYVVFGKTYTPIADNRPFKQRGAGSWYGKKFHGQKTSSGEIYDMYKMTAAHPTLPIPSYVRVTNLSNGRQVIVRVNDRGPFLHGRIIDLSYTAALKLGYLNKGSAQLEVERLLPDEIERMAKAKQNQANDSQSVATAALESGVLDRAEVPAAIQVSEVHPPAPITVVSVGAGVYLQLGAYSQKSNAESMRNSLLPAWPTNLPALEVAQQGSLHRIYAGPFTTRAEAEAAARELEAAGSVKPMIVQR